MLAYAEAGDSFSSAIRKVQDSLRHPEDYCDLMFNGIRIRVAKNSNIHDLSTIYDLCCHIQRLECM